jgi:putative flippase GtrA
VDSARRLYERFRQLIHEGAKFGIVGFIGFVISDGGTNLLRSSAHMGWLTANVIATLVAMVFTYVANRYWTFRHRERTTVGREGLLFFIFNGVGLAIQLACLGFTVHVLGQTGKVPANVALFVGIVLGTLFRFWSYRKWVWADKPEALPAGHEAIEPVLAPTSAVSPPTAPTSPAGKPH